MTPNHSVLHQALGEANADLTSSDQKNQLSILVNGEQITTHTPITSGFAQKIADEVARVQKIEKDGEYFAGTIELSIDVTLLLEMIHNANKVAELLGKSGVDINKNDVFYRDNDWGSITYGGLWRTVSSETGTQSFVSHIMTKDESEQIRLLQHIHNFQIPEGRISLEENYIFRWKIGAETTESIEDLVNRLNGPLKKDDTEEISISGLFEKIKSKRSRENVIRYCLYCYSAGIQLKP